MDPTKTNTGTGGTKLSLLDGLPSPGAIQSRLGEIAREERLLNRLLRLSLRAEDERAKRIGRGHETK